MFEAGHDLIIFDELHKQRGWKNHIKGIYDKNKGLFKIIVTGSARLNMYKKGGDSLMGRYVYFRLHPFSLAELLQINNNHSKLPHIKPQKHSEATKVLQRLLKFGGFPEPYLKHSTKNLRRWQNQRTELLIKQDIRETK